MEITPEGVILAAGWVFSVVLCLIGWWKIPTWARNRQTEALKNPEDPARIALGGAITEDVLPKFREAFKQELSDIQRRVQGFDSQVQRVEQAVNAVEARVAAIKVPTGPEVWASMKEEVVKTIIGASEMDMEEIARPLREAIVAQMAAVKFDLTPMAEKMVEAMKPRMQEMLDKLLTDEYRKELMKAVRGHRGEKGAEREAELVEVMADAMEHPEEAARIKAGLDLFGPILKKQGIDPGEQLRLVKAARVLVSERAGATGAGVAKGGGRAPGVP